MYHACTLSASQIEAVHTGGGGRMVGGMDTSGPRADVTKPRPGLRASWQTLAPVMHD